MFGFAVFFLGDREEAKDAAQDVMIRLWTHRHRIDPERAPGWLMTVTRNICIDHQRRRRTDRRYVAVDSDRAEMHPSDHIAADAEVDRQMFRQRLTEAITTLREPQRSIVIMREIQELKYEEISQVLGLPLNTVKVYLHRARRTLRRHLTPVIEREAII